MKSYRRYSILSLLLVAGCTTAQSGKEPFNIQAHRGAGLARPENTLESFEWSWSHEGITPEADLRTTKDGIIVTFHDKNFKRVPSNAPEKMKKLGVEDVTFQQLEKLDVGAFRGKEFAGQRVPALTQVFEAMRNHPERMIYLDIKEMKTEDYPKLAGLIKEYGLTKQCIFTTSHYDLIRMWKKIMPDSPTMLWVWTRKDPKKQNAVLADVRAQNFADLTFLQIHVHPKDGTFDPSAAEPFKYPTKAFLESVRAELAEHGVNFQMLPWKCQDPAIFTYLLEFGAKSFATDYPEVSFKAVQDFQKKKEGE